MKVSLFGRASALAVALAMSGLASHAAAQQPAAGPSAEQPPADTNLEAVVITGSFLKGKEETALPVDVIGVEELSQRGAPTMVQFIKTIPSSGAVLGENNRFGGGNGVSTVNLRNLGTQRTLVLMNGHRIAGTIRSLGGVDLNTLPSNAIGRVDVLKDGAAATYGSDAIGGVVNFITRTDLKGFEFTGQYQAIQGSAGDYNAGIAWGNKNDRGNVLFTANYRARSELPVSERAWALRTGYAGYLQNPLGGWAGTGNPGVYNTATTAPTGSPTTGYTAATFSGTLQDIGCLANGGVPASVGSQTIVTTQCAFQYTTFDNIVEDEKNLQLYGEVNFDVTDKVRFHSGLSYATNNTPNQSWAVTGPNQWPTPILPSGNSIGGGLSPIPATTGNEQSRFYIPNTNPGLIALAQQVAAATCTGSVLPYGTNATNCATGLAAAQAQAANALLYGVAPSQLSWRPIGFGGDPSTADMHSHYSYKTTSFRIDGGFKGEFANGIGWDASALYQNVKYDATLSDISVNRLQLALEGLGGPNCTGSTPGANGCYYFNPFTNAFANSMSGDTANPYYVASSSTITGFNDAAAQRASLAKWMQSKQPNHNTTELFVGELIFNGEVPFKLFTDSKPSWAAGGQYRYDRIVDAPEQIYDANATPCVDSAPFGDNIPSCSLPNGPFLFNANRRPYDVNRKITAYFVEARLPVTDKLEFTLAGRTEEYSGLGRTTNPKLSGRFQAFDWLAFRGSVGSTYRAPNPTTTTNTFNRGLVNPNGTWRASDTYGNPNLKPETADTMGLGVLFDFKRFSASIDYWSFKFQDQLTTESTTDLIAIMFPGGAADTGARCGDATYAAIQQRFTFSGPCGRANIQSYKVNNINGGEIKTSGYDFQANYDFGELAWGTGVKVGIDGTYLDKYDEAPYTFLGTTFMSSSTGITHRAGTYRASIFTGYNRWRGNAFFNLNKGIHNLRWQTRFIAATTQVEATPVALANPASFNSTIKVAAYFQHDVTYRVDLPWQDVQLTLGVQNVFDKEPSFAFGTQYNYDPSSGSPLGRVYTLGLKKKF
jgi:iron complex outermembrane receptor protein